MLTQETLFYAWLKVRDNAGAGGVDGQSVENFALDVFRHLSILLTEIQSGDYSPKPLKRVYKQEADKSRPLSIPCVRDRIVQTAIAQFLTPLLEPHFEEVSFAYRQGRSVQQAIQLVVKHYKAGYHWVVDADIRAYFDEVPHDQLFVHLRQYLQALSDADRSLIETLIKQWLACPVMDKDKRYKIQKGIPQGSPLSPLLANLYLDQLDDSLLAENKKIVRFADDFLILCRSQAQAEATLELTGSVLADLQLVLHEEKTNIKHFDSGFQFLGHQFIRSIVFKRTKEEILDKKPMVPDPADNTNKNSQLNFNETSQPDVPLNDALNDSAAKQQTAMARAFQLALDGKEQLFDLSQPIQDNHSTNTHQDEPNKANAEIDPQKVQLDSLMRTLYLLSHDIQVSKISQRLKIESDDTEQQLPLVGIDTIVVFGNAQFSTQALRLCLNNNVEIHFTNKLGRYYGQLVSPNLGRCQLHQQQFRLQNPINGLNNADIYGQQSDFSQRFCRAILEAKFSNSLTVLRRLNRRAEPTVKARSEEAIQFIKNEKNKLASLKDENLNVMMGMEGASAKYYFSVIAELCKAHDLNWDGRQARPATDPVNAALNFLYTLLYNNLVSLLHGSGLNPYVGYLHALKRHHAALASDLMEPFRAIIVDSIIIRFIKDGTFSETTSELNERGKLPESTIKLLIQAFEERMNQSVKYFTYLDGQKVERHSDMRRILADQIRQTKAWIMGDVNVVDYYKGR